jgi:hypothetical protein
VEGLLLILYFLLYYKAKKPGVGFSGKAKKFQTLNMLVVIGRERQVANERERYCK